MQTARKIAEYAVNTRFESFPNPVITRAKDLALSALGSAVLGAGMDVTEVLHDYVRANGAPAEAGVIGKGYRTSAEFAALVNCSASHCTELEDVAFPEAVYTCHLIPSVFAVGEKMKSRGKDVLSALIIGYEVSARPGVIATNGGAFDRGWLAPPHLGTMGVAAAAARLMGLSVEQTEGAITLAASLASGLFRQTGTGAHVIEAGISGRNGVAAAVLAKAGLAGNPTILNGKAGYYDALSGHPELDFDLASDDSVRLMQVGVKRYPCCYFLQRIIDSVTDIMKKNKLTADDVESVTIAVNAMFNRVVRYEEPTDGEEARFSLPHAVAAALSGQRVFFDTFTTAKVNDPKLKELRKKVKWVRHADFEGGVMEADNPITVRLKSGVEHKVSATLHKGEPRNPLTQSEIIERFKHCAEDVLPESRMDEIANLVYRMDSVDDVSKVMAPLTAVH